MHKINTQIPTTSLFQEQFSYYLFKQIKGWYQNPLLIFLDFKILIDIPVLPDTLFNDKSLSTI